MKSINLNENVRVKLTDRGYDVLFETYIEKIRKLKEHFKKNNPEFIEKHGIGHIARTCVGYYKEPEVDSEGYSTFQLWDVMFEFGPYLDMAVDLPIETDILIADSSLNDNGIIYDSKKDNEPNYKAISLNSFVGVKLTPKATKILKSRKDIIKPQVDENGYTYFQLWQLMNIFGKNSYMGSDLIFDGFDMLISEENLKEYDPIKKIKKSRP